MQHALLHQLFGEKYFFPRIENPMSILECGYGGGDWAVQIAEEYEDCEVSAWRNQRRYTVLHGNPPATL